MTKSGLIDVSVQVHHITERAILVSDDGDRDKAIWLPLSQIEVEDQEKSIAMITLPEWLALDKGLI